MLERLSRNKPTYVELSTFWFVAANMHPYYRVYPEDMYLSIEGYKALERSWYSLFVAAYKGEI